MTSEGAAEAETTSSRPLRRAIVFGLVVGVPASIVFLWLAFRNADPDAVWTAAREADLGLVALAILAIAVVHVFQAARWRRIAQTDRPRLARFLELVVGAVACNNVLPGRLGELFRARWLAVDAAIPSGRALATVGLDRGSDVVALFLFLVVSLPFVASAGWIEEIAIGGALLVALLSCCSGERVHTRESGIGTVASEDASAASPETPWTRSPSRSGVDSSPRRSGSACSPGARSRSRCGGRARSLGIELGFVDSVFVTAVVNLGVAIPSSPGFVGTYQWLSVAALGVFDVSRDDALAFSFLLQASWYVPTTIVGGFLVLFRLDWGLGLRS